MSFPEKTFQTIDVSKLEVGQMVHLNGVWNIVCEISTTHGVTLYLLPLNGSNDSAGIFRRLEHGKYLTLQEGLSWEVQIENPSVLPFGGAHYRLHVVIGQNGSYCVVGQYSDSNATVLIKQNGRSTGNGDTEFMAHQTYQATDFSVWVKDKNGNTVGDAPLFRVSVSL